MPTSKICALNELIGNEVFYNVTIRSRDPQSLLTCYIYTIAQTVICVKNPSKKVFYNLFIMSTFS